MGERQTIFRYVVAVVIIGVMICAGCAKPPTEEMAKAQKAVDDAKQKEAHLYVPDAFKKAEDNLNTAKNLVANKSYKEAKKIAEETVQLAQQAIVMVEPAKAKMKADAEQIIQDIEKGLQEIKELVAKAIKKKVLKAREEIQGKIGKWEVDLVAVKEKLAAGEVKQAYDDLKPMNEQITAEKENVNTLLTPAAGKKK